MMRAIVYVTASLAALGIVIALATAPKQTGSPEPATASASATAAAADSPRVLDQPGTLTLHVPEMHCPFACYPAVKETLQSDSAVSAVELAEQKEEGVIDDPKVIVRYDEGFDVDAAIDSLAQKGFTDSTLVP